MPRPALVITLGVLLLLPLTLHAQDVRPGSRIRVTGPCGTGEHCVPVTGNFVGWTGTTLMLEDGQGGERRFDVTTGSTVEVFRGSRGHALAGLGIGTGVGLVAGLLLAGECFDDVASSPIEGLCGANVIAGAGLGALTGLLIGSMMKTERWDRISAPGIGLRRVTGGMGLAVHLAF